MKNLGMQVSEEFASHQALVSDDNQDLLEVDKVMSMTEFTNHEEAIILSTTDDGMPYLEAVSVLMMP